jgi:nicotinamidase-related amidase
LALAWLAGASRPTDRASGTCLLIVDLQNDMIHQDGASGGQKLSPDQRLEIVGNTLRLLQLARNRQWPIVYVQR